ncbi:outer membrane lipoprotein carrier protein LolA, partial [Micromonospora zhanjiangensis]
ARSAAQLLVDLQTARLDGLSGTVVQRADLGLPAVVGLAGQVGQGGTELTSLLAGTHTLRVWYAGPERQRIALMGTLGETDVIHNGKDVWTWNSQRNEATHRTMTGKDGAADRHAVPDGLPATPQQAAERALAAVNPTTEVTVGRSARIAGRDAYELVLGPRDKTSLVGQVRIAIDAKEHVPLRFEVYAKGTDQPAYEMAFTQVDFSRPDAAQFAFNPPPGAKVTESDAVEAKESAPTAAQRQQAEAAAKQARPTTVGTGWTTVLVAHLPKDGTLTGDKAGKADKAGATAGADKGDIGQLTGLLDKLPKVSGAWGSGHLFSSKLVTALLTDDGRVLVGAVAPERLYEVAQANK